MSTQQNFPTRRILIVSAMSMALLALMAPLAVAQEAEATPTTDAAEKAQEAAEEAAPTAPVAPQQAQAQRVFRHSYVVIIDGRAEVNGVLTMVFEPNGGEAKQVRVNVMAKTNAKKIGKDLANQLAFAAGSDYKVKGNGAKITVKAKSKKAAPFWIGIEQQSLTGVSVRITKG